jgi:hypothetical protein
MTKRSIMIRKFVRADGMFITIESKDPAKDPILMLHKANGGMVHLQFVKDVAWQVEQIRKEGFEEDLVILEVGSPK